MGLRTTGMREPIKPPMTVQKGKMNPAKKPPRSVPMMTGVAGSTLSVFWVRSMKGIGISCKGRFIKAPVMVGMPA